MGPCGRTGSHLFAEFRYQTFRNVHSAAISMISLDYEQSEAKVDV